MAVPRASEDSDIVFVEPRRAVSLGFTINGEATTTEGTTLKVHGHVRAVLLPTGDFKIFNEETRVQ
jgi:hypothetical protein